MGCYNATCELSNLPILGGEEVIVFPTIYNGKYNRTTLVPFEGTYNEYGSVSDIKATPIVTRMFEAIKANRVSVKFTKEELTEYKAFKKEDIRIGKLKERDFDAEMNHCMKRYEIQDRHEGKVYVNKRDNVDFKTYESMCDSMAQGEITVLTEFNADPKFDNFGFVMVSKAVFETLKNFILNEENLFTIYGKPCEKTGNTWSNVNGEEYIQHKCAKVIADGVELQNKINSKMESKDLSSDTKFFSHVRASWIDQYTQIDSLFYEKLYIDSIFFPELDINRILVDEDIQDSLKNIWLFGWMLLMGRRSINGTSGTGSQSASFKYMKLLGETITRISEEHINSGDNDEH